MSIWQDKTIEERIAIVQNTALRTNIEDLAIEKDWWVTITLKALFSTSFSEFLLFKGGTSLSKGKWENIDLREVLKISSFILWLACLLIFLAVRQVSRL